MDIEYLGSIAASPGERCGFEDERRPLGGPDGEPIWCDQPAARVLIAADFISDCGIERWPACEWHEMTDLLEDSPYAI